MRGNLELFGAVVLLAISVVTKSLAGPYIDPSQLDVPWPKHSHYKQPWRAFLETKSGYDFLNGIGVNYNVRSNDELAVRILSEAGFKTFRIEIGWGNTRWEEDGLNNDERISEILLLCKKYGIRPTILLNAHQGVPCPVRFFRKKLAEDATEGSIKIKLTDTEGIVAGRSGINNLTDYWSAEAIITEINQATGECMLSKPLPKPLQADEVKMATLKYLPLYPVGTPEFNETADGWVRYALLVSNFVRDTGIEDFDIEIWNELTFGTRFLNINNYYEPDVVEFKVDFLREGGQCWELARRTISAVKSHYPEVRCIWGFSNTTFFHTPIEELPPGTDGQSYHPYGTGTRKLPEQEYHRDRPEMNLEGYTPTLEIRMCEGWAHTFIQTESLMRLTNPEARRRHPPETERFFHYITEHGVVPSECGINDEVKAWELKTKCVLRSFSLWLNKGIDTLHYFCAYDDNALGMGLLPPELYKMDINADFNDIATFPLEALRNFTMVFSNSELLDSIDQLDVDVEPLSQQIAIFGDDNKYPRLWHKDVFAFLPFQVNKGKFAVVVYVMTYDATKTMEEERYCLNISSLPAKLKSAKLYDPIQDRFLSPEVTNIDENNLSVNIHVLDYPCVLTLELESR